jgi:hypothetical protein
VKRNPGQASPSIPDFALLNPGYARCKEKHLHRNLVEYDFRYNHRVAFGFNDGERAALSVKNAAGKRLTYRGTH